MSIPSVVTGKQEITKQIVFTSTKAKDEVKWVKETIHTEDIFKAVNLLQNLRQKDVKFYQPRVKGDVKGKTKLKNPYI